VHFWDRQGVAAGYPLAGTIFVADVGYNLNLPRLAAGMIRAGLERGWLPERERVVFEIADGVDWLSALEPGLA
jgi:hypothetical protein